MVFNDTQCIEYLLGALRHEKQEWENVHSSITSSQIKGNITFAEACDELRVRCEASRANDVMDRPVGGKRVSTLADKVTDVTPESLTVEQVFAYISTMAMKHNSDITPSKSDKRQKGAKVEEQTPFPLCVTHYHSLIAARSPSIKLKQNYGTATYNADTTLVVYPWLNS
jgi:hypothetical protein